MSEKTNISVIKSAEKELYYYRCLVRSLESKLDRVEPKSFEFEALMDQLFSAKESLEKSAFLLCKQRYLEANKDILPSLYFE